MNGGEQDDLDCLLTDHIAVIGVICCLSRALIPGQLPAGVSRPGLLVTLFHEKHVTDYARISMAAFATNEYMNNQVLDKRLDAGSPRTEPRWQGEGRTTTEVATTTETEATIAALKWTARLSPYVPNYVIFSGNQIVVIHLIFSLPLCLGCEAKMFTITMKPKAA
jgi:hypothetical protein